MKFLSHSLLPLRRPSSNLIANPKSSFAILGVVRRLFQFGVLLLGLAALLTPLVELCDRWDPPGPPMSDTEFSVFALILILCLILVVSKLVAARSKVLGLVTLFRLQDQPVFLSEDTCCFISIIPPHPSPPLQI